MNVGWPLGAMLYEINSLPWTFHPAPSDTEPHAFSLPDVSHAPPPDVDAPDAPRARADRNKTYFVMDRETAPASTAAPAVVFALLVGVALSLLALQSKHAKIVGDRDAWATDAPGDARRHRTCCDAWSMAPHHPKFPMPQWRPAENVANSPSRSLRSGSLP